MSISYPLAVTTPILFESAYNVESGELCMKIQPLAAIDRITLVGKAEIGGPYQVQDGRFIAPFAFGLPGESIPFEDLPPGTAVDFDFRLEAQQPTCGLVSGQFTIPARVPANLQGSTFALTPLTDPQAHALPLIDCGGKRAEPL